MATIALEEKSSILSKQKKIKMKTSSNRRRSKSCLNYSGRVRKVMVEPDGRTQSMKSDVSTCNSSVFTMRPLPPLVKNHNDHHTSTENTSSSYIQVKSSKPTLPPIKQANQISSHGKLNKTGKHFKCHRKISQLSGRVDEIADISDGEPFIPVRISTPKNSQIALLSTPSGRTLSKPNRITFRQSSGKHEYEDSPSTNDSPSDSEHCGNKKERRRLSNAKTQEWVRASNFALKTADDSKRSSSLSNTFPTISSIAFDDGRSPENRHKPTSTEQIRRIVSNIHPPDLPFKILVHERVIKFNVDLQFRVQHIKDWWNDLRFPRLPKVTIDIDFSRSREAVRGLCIRLRESLRCFQPIILDPPPRFVIYPPSAWHLKVPMVTDESSRDNKQSLKQYNRELGCYVQGDVAMVADEDGDLVHRRSRRDSRSGRHVSFVDETDDHVTTISEFRRRGYSSSSRKVSMRCHHRPMPKLPTPMTKKAGVSEAKFNDARERLASVLKKLDDPSWFGAWIAKHDEMEKDIKRLNHKRLDLIRALTFTVDNDPCQGSTNIDRLHDDDNAGAEMRTRMRVHQQYAHHRFGMPQRQPSTSLHPDASAQGSKDMEYCSKLVQPVYTDDRYGCIACRVMKAASRYGCEDRLTTLSVQPKIENYSTIAGDTIITRQN